MMTLRELRESAGLTQEALADLSQVHQTTISQLETGRNRDPQWSTVKALADALKKDPSAVAAAILESGRAIAS